MNFLHKIIALIFLAAIAYSIDANAGDDRTVYTEHNGDIDANLTTFTLDGSLSGPSDNISFYFWKVIGAPDGEEIVILDQNSQQATFESSVEYGGADKVFQFELTVHDNLGDLILDLNNNGVYDVPETYIDTGDGVYTVGEIFYDANPNGQWDEGESFVDINGNGQWDDAEVYTDEGNGQWDDGEYFEDANPNGQWDE